MAQELLKDLVPKFINSLKEKGRSPATVLAYRADLDQLVAFLQGKNKVLVTAVLTSDLEEFRDALLSQKYTPKSVSRKLNAIKTFYRWLALEKVVISDPSAPVSHPKIEASAPRFLSPIEYRALRDVVRTDIRVSAIVEIILQTGLRISEIASLKLENIKNDAATIEAFATQPQRTIPFNSAAKAALNSYLTQRPKSDSPYVFISKNGKALAIRNIRAAVDRYIQKAELPNYSVNDLRTTFMVENLKAGVDLVTLSQVSGHKRLSTTERYLELAQIKESGKRQNLVEL